MTKKLIKSKERVSKFGEVFTPDWVVQKMLDTPGIKEACEDLSANFLEPAAGDGNFLVAILQRKLDIVMKNYSNSLGQFENFSLYALSSLYGIELLEDNAQKCVMNMVITFQKEYHDMARSFKKPLRTPVINSAKHIISKNIVQGDFLKRIDSYGKPIVFIEWKPLIKINDKTQTIKVLPTEYRLDDIYEKSKNKSGLIYENEENSGQLDMFDKLPNSKKSLDPSKERYRYKPCTITSVYREVVEVDD